MANKTIYGCLNLTTKQVVFQGEACDDGDYTGCYVASGVHEGQIAVTISEANCDDTYYACFNSTTGKFQLIIPDDCCEVLGSCCNAEGEIGNCEVDVLESECVYTWSSENSCDYCVGLCEHDCFLPERVPRSYYIRISMWTTLLDIEPCEIPDCLNGDYQLELTNCSVNSATYQLPIYNGLRCTENSCAPYYRAITLTIKDAFTMFSSHICGGSTRQDSGTITGCVGRPSDTITLDGVCHRGDPNGTRGTVVISEIPLI